MSPAASADRLLTLDEVASFLGIPKSTLYAWRSMSPKQGPRGIKVGKYVRVRQSELDRWLEEQAEDVEA
ncbi:helix-turn-helix transcriptional regulator [Euzebya tangerina]|uniref:helix-turn-helix transcriptional regulator n=1 Tax=Euzebya tangerina TaxID=591198 RepID=UPI000E3140E7|nr:helix-turn-helix domain-containing protein [Euzebya tangerina]